MLDDRCIWRCHAAAASLVHVHAFMTASTGSIHQTVLLYTSNEGPSQGDRRAVLLGQEGASANGRFEVPRSGRCKLEAVLACTQHMTLASQVLLWSSHPSVWSMQSLMGVLKSPGVGGADLKMSLPAHGA